MSCEFVVGLAAGNEVGRRVFIGWDEEPTAATSGTPAAAWSSRSSGWGRDSFQWTTMHHSLTQQLFLPPTGFIYTGKLLLGFYQAGLMQLLKGEHSHFPENL